MAMRDALELSESLTADRFSSTSCAAYEAGMRKRAAVAAQESLENGEIMHSQDALSSMLAFFRSHD